MSIGAYSPPVVPLPAMDCSRLRRTSIPARRFYYKRLRDVDGCVLTTVALVALAMGTAGCGATLRSASAPCDIELGSIGAFEPQSGESRSCLWAAGNDA